MIGISTPTLSHLSNVGRSIKDIYYTFFTESRRNVLLLSGEVQTIPILIAPILSVSLPPSLSLSLSLSLSQLSATR